MEQNTQDYDLGHYAAQNREEMGAAISRRSTELDAKQFGEKLDVYDKDHELLLSSIAVTTPVKMLKKLAAQKKKRDKTTEKEAGLRECCGFLNDLIEQLRTP